MWLIEAYRTQHGPSYAREVLTVAAGNSPDADAIMTFTSFLIADMEEMGWRDADSGLVAGHPISTWLSDEMRRTIGTYGYDEKATHWRSEEA